MISVNVTIATRGGGGVTCCAASLQLIIIGVENHFDIVHSVLPRWTDARGGWFVPLFWSSIPSWPLPPASQPHGKFFGALEELREVIFPYFYYSKYINPK
jgi:hypothetical protein